MVRIEGVLFCSFWPDHKVTGIGICPWIRDFLFSFILMISFEKSVFMQKVIEAFGADVYGVLQASGGSPDGGFVYAGEGN